MQVEIYLKESGKLFTVIPDADDVYLEGRLLNVYGKDKKFIGVYSLDDITFKVTHNE